MLSFRQLTLLVLVLQCSASSNCMMQPLLDLYYRHLDAMILGHDPSQSTRDPYEALRSRAESSPPRNVLAGINWDSAAKDPRAESLRTRESLK